MITIRKGEERGHFDHGWLDTYHTFSFAEYRDPNHRGFRSLRVINEDRVAPGQGFGEHPHRDMEIITYVLEGQLEHRDSLGSGSIIHAGDVQRMTAGSGITHSEFNPSDTEPVHLYQIWLFPDAKGLTPEYEERTLSKVPATDGLKLLASPDGREQSMRIHQDALLWIATTEPGRDVSYDLPAGRYAWVQVTRGTLELNGQTLLAGDGAAVEDVETLHLTSRGHAEALIFDLG